MHCRSEQEAEALKAELQTRLAECQLEMHPTKTKVVYCKDGKRKGKYPNVKFDFLGYCFQPRLVRNHRNKSLFCGFNPAVSVSAMKAMREAIRDLNIWHQTQLTLQDIARKLNPLLRGWIGYYGHYAPSALYPLLRHVNQRLRAWVNAEVQALQRPQDPGKRVSATTRSGRRGPLRSLAGRYDRSVCLMGAECGESLMLGSARG